MALSLFKAGISARLSKLTHIFKDEESETVALKIPMARCSEFLVKLQDFLIKEEGVSSIAKEPNQISFDNRLLLLNKSVDANLSQLPEDLKQWIEDQKIEVIKFSIVKGLKTFSLEEAIQKLLNAETGIVDPRIKIETLKQFKIIELTEKQKKYTEEIAQLVLEKGGHGTQAVLEKVNITNNQPFLSYSYRHLCGVNNSKLDLKEGNCQFLLDPTQVYFDNFAQEERDTLINSVKTSANIVDLFGNIILDNRLAKERAAHVKTYLRSNQQAQIFHSSYNLNASSQQNKSIARSLSQQTHQGNIDDNSKGSCNKISGSLETETGEVYEFLQSLHSQKFNYDILIISEILQDISFICSFVGLGKTENDVSVYFQLLVSEEQYDSKSIHELIITQLNDQINKFSKSSSQSASSPQNLFEKTDLISVSTTTLDNHKNTETDSLSSSKKSVLLNINLKITKEVLGYSEQLIDAVKNYFTKSKNIHETSSNDNEPALSKKLKTSNEDQ